MQLRSLKRAIDAGGCRSLSISAQAATVFNLPPSSGTGCELILVSLTGATAGWTSGVLPDKTPHSYIPRLPSR